MTTSYFTRLLAVLLVVTATRAVATTPAAKCNADKLKLAGKYAQCRAKATAKAIKTGDSADYGRCDAKLPEKWSHTELGAEGACPTNGDAADVQGQVSADIGVLDLMLAGIRFIDNADGTITDTETGLMWEKKTPVNAYDQISWYDAMGNFTSNLNGNTAFGPDQTGLGGHSDWRLPTTAEILTIGIPGSCFSSPCVAPIFLPTGSAPYWTSTTFASQPVCVGCAVCVRFVSGNGPGLCVSGKPNNHHARGVRRAW